MNLSTPITEAIVGSQDGKPRSLRAAFMDDHEARPLTANLDQLLADAGFNAALSGDLEELVADLRYAAAQITAARNAVLEKFFFEGNVLPQYRTRTEPHPDPRFRVLEDHELVYIGDEYRLDSSPNWKSTWELIIHHGVEAFREGLSAQSYKLATIRPGHRIVEFRRRK